MLKSIRFCSNQCLCDALTAKLLEVADKSKRNLRVFRVGVTCEWVGGKGQRSESIAPTSPRFDSYGGAVVDDEFFSAVPSLDFDMCLMALFI